MKKKKYCSDNYGKKNDFYFKKVFLDDDFIYITNGKILIKVKKVEKLEVKKSLTIINDCNNSQHRQIAKLSNYYNGNYPETTISQIYENYFIDDITRETIEDSETYFKSLNIYYKIYLICQNGREILKFENVRGETVLIALTKKD